MKYIQKRQEPATFTEWKSQIIPNPVVKTRLSGQMSFPRRRESTSVLGNDHSQYMRTGFGISEDWQPTWEILRSSEKRDLHDALLREQGYICCYCEMRITQQNSHIEHL